MNPLRATRVRIIIDEVEQTDEGLQPVSFEDQISYTRLFSETTKGQLSPIAARTGMFVICAKDLDILIQQWCTK
jgi:hypothetical protein